MNQPPNKHFINLRISMPCWNALVSLFFPYFILVPNRRLAFIHCRILTHCLTHCESTYLAQCLLYPGLITTREVTHYGAIHYGAIHDVLSCADYKWIQRQYFYGTCTLRPFHTQCIDSCTVAISLQCKVLQKQASSSNMHVHLSKRTHAQQTAYVPHYHHQHCVGHAHQNPQGGYWT